MISLVLEDGAYHGLFWGLGWVAARGGESEDCGEVDLGFGI